MSLVMDPVESKGKHEHASKERTKSVSVDPEEVRTSRKVKVRYLTCANFS